MYQNYEAGNDGNAVNISIKVGTVGIAILGVYLSPPAGQWIPLPDIDDNNGNINQYNLGVAENLRNKYLLINTTFDFSPIDESLWKQQLNKLVLRYTLHGGLNGDLSMNFDRNDSISSKKGKLVEINKIIFLK